MNGLRDELRDRILVANPHLRILTFGQSLRMDTVAGRARYRPRRARAWSRRRPEVLTQSLARNSAGYMSTASSCRHRSDTGTRSVTTLPRKIRDGDLRFKTTRDSVDGGIILGHRLANRMSAFTGDVVELVRYASAKVNAALGTMVPRFWRLGVTGVFDTGMYQYDDGFGFVSLALAQQLRRARQRRLTGIQIKVDGPVEAPAIGAAPGAEARLSLPLARLAEPRTRSCSRRWSSRSWRMGLIICIIMIVAAFNIVGTLTMVVTEKTPRNRHPARDGAHRRAASAGCS